MTIPAKPLPDLLPRTDPANVRANAIAIAKSQKGLKEGHDAGGWNNDQPYSVALGWGTGMPWCKVFGTWTDVTAGIPRAWVPMTSSCSAAVTWYLGHDRLHTEPETGDEGFLQGGDGPDASDGHPYKHTFRVWAVEGDYVRTVEGNTNTAGSAQGSGVNVLRRRWKGGSTIKFGRPFYAKGVDLTLAATVVPLHWAQLQFVAEHRSSHLYGHQVRAFKKALDAVSPQQFHLKDNGTWGDGADAMIRWVQKHRLGDEPDPKGAAFLGPLQMSAFCDIPDAAQYVRDDGDGGLTLAHTWLAAHHG